MLHALELCLRAGSRLAGVWLTHHHGDHVGAASAVAKRFGAPVCAHRETARRLEGVVNVTELLEHDEVRVLAGSPERRLRCIHTPGHAPGHLCFHEEVTGAMVAGDMVAGIGTILVDPSEGDMAEYLRSLREMEARSPALLLPAHGMVLTEPGETLRRYVAHRLWREERVMAALTERETSLEELVGTAYADTPAALHPLAERSTLAHLRKLEAEERAVCGELGWRRGLPSQR